MVAAIRNAEWYAQFPEDYLWSYNVLLVLSVLALLFTRKLLPETKGLSVEEVVAEFERESEASSLQKT